MFHGLAVGECEKELSTASTSFTWKLAHEATLLPRVKVHYRQVKISLDAKNHNIIPDAFAAEDY